MGCVQSIANPVSLARRVMEDTPHCLLVGEGALKFAKKVGFPILANPLELVTKESHEHCKDAKDYLGNIEFRNDVTGWDTVGAVALDSNGGLASATSTGINKLLCNVNMLNVKQFVKIIQIESRPLPT